MASTRGLLGNNFVADGSACTLTFRTSSSDTSSGSSRPKDLIPTSSHAFFLLRTYDSESFLVPTRTTARPGTCRRQLDASEQLWMQVVLLLNSVPSIAEHI